MSDRQPSEVEILASDLKVGDEFVGWRDHSFDQLIWSAVAIAPHPDDQRRIQVCGQNSENGLQVFSFYVDLGVRRIDRGKA